MPSTDWPDVVLHVVSGKGGTGKTTVAAALALALARDGRQVMLMEVEGRQGLAQLFDTPPLPYEERKLASAPGGGEVWGLDIGEVRAWVVALDDTGVEQQQATSADIATNLNRISDISDLNYQGIARVAETSQQLDSLAEQQESLVKRFRLSA